MPPRPRARPPTQARGKNGVGKDARAGKADVGEDATTKAPADPATAAKPASCGIRAWRRDRR
jgi:hypothetical protein